MLKLVAGVTKCFTVINIKNEFWMSRLMFNMMGVKV